MKYQLGVILEGKPHILFDTDDRAQFYNAVFSRQGSMFLWPGMGRPNDWVQREDQPAVKENGQHACEE